MADAVPSKTNGFDPKKTSAYVKRIDSVYRQLESLKGKYMSECKGYRKDITDILDEAKSIGIPKKAFKSYLRERELLSKAADVRDELEGDDQDSFDMIKQAMGELADTPLGQAALSKAKGAEELEDLTSAKH